MAIGNFGFSIERCMVTVCMENDINQFYFFSKYPERIAPTWNLIQLFPPSIWGLVFVSILMIVLFFHVSSWIYYQMGLEKDLFKEELVLVPVRF